MTVFCVRIKKCENLSNKWNNENVYMEIWSTSKLWECRPTMLKNGMANWGEMGEEYPAFSFATEAASKPKLMLTFKLKVAGKGKKIGVAKWKLDAFTFVNKTDLVSTVIKKKDGAPKLVCNIIDNTALKKKGKIPSFLAFTQTQGQAVGVAKKERRLSSRMSAALVHKFLSEEKADAVEFGDSKDPEKPGDSKKKKKGGKNQAEKRDKDEDDEDDEESASTSSSKKTHKKMPEKTKEKCKPEPKGKAVPNSKQNTSEPKGKIGKGKKGKYVTSETSDETVWEAFSESISKGEYDFEEDSDTDAESVYEDLKLAKPNQDNPEKTLFAPSTVIKGKETYDIQYKVIILGDSSVGKRWDKNSAPTDTRPTVTTGFGNKTFKVENDIIRVQFWDTAGQERYRAMTRQYYNGANGAVIVYNIADAGTFANVASWLKDLITSISEEIPILLIGNKSDLDKKDLRQDAQNFAKSRSLFFIETSARDGDNCTQAMQLILQKIHLQNANNSKTEEKPKPGGKSAFTLGAKMNTEGEEEESGDGEDENCC